MATGDQRPRAIALPEAAEQSLGLVIGFPDEIWQPLLIAVSTKAEELVPPGSEDPGGNADLPGGRKGANRRLDAVTLPVPGHLLHKMLFLRRVKRPADPRPLAAPASRVAGNVALGEVKTDDAPELRVRGEPLGNVRPVARCPQRCPTQVHPGQAGLVEVQRAAAADVCSARNEAAWVIEDLAPLVGG